MFDLALSKNKGFQRLGVKKAEFLHNNQSEASWAANLRQKRGIIYLIVNMVNGKMYVGQTKKTFKGRYKSGWWITTDNDHLFKAAQKYGHENFRILILEEGRWQNILNILETYYILSFRSNEEEFGYNKTTGGNSYAFSPDTILKMRLSSPLLRSKEEFTELAKQKHGDKYDYSKVEYINTNTNVNIICNKHNEIFIQTPGVHLQSKIGCPKCVLEDASKRYSMPFEEFKRRSIEKYNDEFKFYPETFKRIHESTKLTHKTCGNTFIVNAYSHLISRTGCKFCGEELRRQSLKKNFLIKSALEKERIANVLGITDYQSLSLKMLKRKLRQKQSRDKNQIRLAEKHKLWYEELIKRSREIHGENSYEYLGITNDLKARLQLKCNHCGKEFSQTVYSHLNLKRGCSKCKHLNKKEIYGPPATN